MLGLAGRGGAAACGLGVLGDLFRCRSVNTSSGSSSANLAPSWYLWPRWWRRRRGGGAGGLAGKGRRYVVVVLVGFCGFLDLAKSLWNCLMFACVFKKCNRVRIYLGTYKVLNPDKISEYHTLVHHSSTHFHSLTHSLFFTLIDQLTNVISNHRIRRGMIYRKKRPGGVQNLLRKD